MKRLLATIVAFTSCVRQPTYVEGGLYSIVGDAGHFAIVKVLKVEGNGVHLRLYSNDFPQRPTDLDESTLYMAGFDHKPGESLGMGHVPISRKSFTSWNARLIKIVPVRDEELAGYRIWLDSEGGFFD